MTPSHFTCTWLLLPFCVLVTLSTGELEFRQDGVPENLEDMALTRQLNRYLDAQANQRTRLSTFLTNPAYKKHLFILELSRQMQRDLLDALADKSNVADVVRKYTRKALNYHRQYNDPINEIPNAREYDLPYYELNNPLERGFEYPNLKLPYLSHKSNRENENFKDQVLAYPHESLSPKHAFYEERDLDKRMKEEVMLDFPGNHRRPIVNDIPKDVERKQQEPSTITPDFTFNFGEPDSLYEKHPFAVKPNDPRFFQDTPFSLDDSDKIVPEETIRSNMKWERADKIDEDEEARLREESTLPVDDRFKDLSAITLPEPERRTGYHPLIVPVTHDLNNDIYFIAIVAGCSAAAMFALVLVSLTWCRLQRGAKAAADIEYPAYGVTGPNKDVSPSGDQRLAQSAQMYHFQHQKQQIIAMENRTSATRDTGSVSEAESDEENEEGDYTVYECPGLASTGEMEVKNPLFHDDPTPATPAQTNKEEDHI